MKTRRTWRRIAGVLARHSRDPEHPERFSPERVRAVLGIIAGYGARDAFRLRRLYARALELDFRRHCLEIEFCGPYDGSFFQKWRDRLQTGAPGPLVCVARENPQLLAGFRVRCGDDLWCHNVRDSLEAFRAAAAAIA